MISKSGDDAKGPPGSSGAASDAAADGVVESPNSGMLSSLLSDSSVSCCSMSCCRCRCRSWRNPYMVFTKMGDSDLSLAGRCRASLDCRGCWSTGPFGTPGGSGFGGCGKGSGVGGLGGPPPVSSEAVEVAPAG